jgi:hypothetical protein
MSKAQRWMHIHGNIATPEIVMGLQVGRIVLSNHSYESGATTSARCEAHFRHR